MSQYFNTGTERIDAQAMRVFAGRLSGKPSCDVTLRECFAARPALAAYKNGAPLPRVRAIFEQELREILL